MTRTTDLSFDDILKKTRIRIGFRLYMLDSLFHVPGDLKIVMSARQTQHEVQAEHSSGTEIRGTRTFRLCPKPV